MPAVPKPSQSKEARAARGLAPRVRSTRVKSVTLKPLEGELTTASVAAQLGIGAGRVRSLVKSGRMALTAKSVQEYAASRRVMTKKAVVVA